MDKISSNIQKKSKAEVPLGLKIGYALGEISDAVAYQGFSFLIFTFYFTVVKVSIPTITLIYILWSIYNAFNDPIMGALSDRTKTKKFGGGRRRPWIVVMTGLLAVIMVLLFTPPMGNDIAGAIYFFMIICLFDTFYTGYSLNNTSLYPEMFTTDKAREEVGIFRRSFMVIGLLIAFVLPGIFIQDMTNIDELPQTLGQYQLTGAILGIIVLLINIPHIKFGVIEPPFAEIEARKTFGFFESLKISLLNKKFVLLCFSSLMNWVVFGLIPMITPIYATHVLEVPRDSFDISLLLVIAFLSSVPGVIFWAKIDKKFGSKVGFIISTIWWLLSFIPFFFISEFDIALICMIFVGVGLGGAPYFLDRNISNIIDEDELSTNMRREASYYGIHALIIRLSTIITVLSVGWVLSTNGWNTYNPAATTPQLILGLKSLMSLFPAGALLIGLILLAFFPLNRSRVNEILQKKAELHTE